MRLLITVIVACGALGAGVWISAQELASPQFRADTDLITLDVTVLDGDRRPVRGLTAADFTIVDGDERLPVTAFDAIDLPPVQARSLDEVAALSPPDVQTNDTIEGRLIAIMFDHTIPYGWPARAARDIARSVLSQMGPADRAAVLFSHSIPGHSFTTNRARLLATVDHPAIGTSIVQPRYDEATGDFVPDPEGGLCHCGVCSFDAITRVARSVMDVPERRKVLVFIGGFLPLNEGSLSARSPCNPYVVPAMQEMLQATQRANLTVYAFDPHGVEAPSEHGAGVIGPGSDAQSNALRALMRNSQGRPQSPVTLLTIADQTGGRAFLNTNEPALRVADVLNETGSYYLLGFERPPGGRPGEFRRVRVEVNRRGVEVLTRPGYYVPAAESPETTSTEDRLEAALEGLLPRSALRLQLGTLPLARQGETPVIGMVVGIEPPEVTGQRQVLAGVFDGDGREVGRAMLRVDSAPRDAADFESAMDEVFLHLEVPRPGEYHVRVAIDDGATGRTASVYDIVDVPDFERAAVSLSGLAIATAAVLPRAATRSDFLPVAPTLQRMFSWTDEVSAYVQVVQPGQVPLRPIALTVRVLDEQGEARFERADILPAGLFNAAGHADFAFVVPTDALTSGTYTLVLDAARDATRATRSARFEIE